MEPLVITIDAEVDEQGRVRLVPREFFVNLHPLPEEPIYEVAVLEVPDPPGYSCEVSWEGMKGESGFWKNVGGVSRSPKIEKETEVKIRATATPKDTNGPPPRSGTIVVKIKKPGKPLPIG